MFEKCRKRIRHPASGTGNIEITQKKAALRTGGTFNLRNNPQQGKETTSGASVRNGTRGECLQNRL
jgi:hypothetical protein